jgi:class 3 adenylate cyclase
MKGECSACGATVRPGAKFCSECGAVLAVRACPSCGTPSESGRFCDECGTPFPDAAAPRPMAAGSGAPIAERRVTSVLFGDLVGFTPLSESKDAEEVRELLSAYFDRCRIIVGRYGGVVEKFIGDAVMAVWGVPTAHEDDAERAVRAGLELVAAIAVMGEEVGASGLAMRVGVVTGEVAVTVGATAEGMVAGDAVNTAARVQSAAEPGRVWVDETTRSLAGAAITFADTGEHWLKGKTEPVRLWAAGSVVAEVGGGQRIDGLEAPFTGRDADLRLVKELFHATEESRRPRLVVLDGEAGIGKSRLAWEFEKYVDGLAATVRWHRGRCLSYGEGVAFWALAEALRTRFGLLEADTGDVVAERLDAGLAELVPDRGDREWLRPRLAALLGADGTGSFAREDLFTAWAAFLEHLARDDSAVALVIDDAQYADDGLLDFLDHLLGTVQAPIFVLALARPELLTRRPGLGARRASVVRLDPLGDLAMAQLVDGLVAGLPDASREWLVARAEGIPLYAVETVRALIDQDLVVPRDGHYVPAESSTLDLDAMGAPASLQALVAARLDSLAPEERALLTAASVLGASFTVDGLVALGTDPQHVQILLESLRDKDLVSVQTDRFSAERGQYRFVQSVVRQVAYSTQSRRDRTTRHLAAAGHLAGQPDASDELAVVIAQHLLDAADAAPDQDRTALAGRASAYLERAAARARRVGAPGEAQRLLETALACAQSEEDRARLHLSAAGVADDAGRPAESQAHAEAAVALFDQVHDRIGAGRAAAAVCRSTPENSAAAVTLAEPRWRALDGVPGAERARFELARALQVATTYLGDHERLMRYGQEAVVLAEALDDPEAMASARLGLGLGYALTGAHGTGVVLLESAAAIARDHGDPRVLARALNNLSAVLNSHDLPTAIGHAEEATEVARRAGLWTWQGIAEVNLAVGLWCAGRLDAVAALLPEDPAASAKQSRYAWAAIEVWLAEARGEPLPPRVADEKTDEVISLAWLASADLARATAAGGDDDVARLAAFALDQMLTAAGLDDDFFVLWPNTVLAALEARDLDLAERLLAPVSEALPGQRSPAVSAQWHRLRGLLAATRGDDPELAETEMRAGVEALAAYGATGSHAQAQEELGRFLAAQGRDDEAGPLLAAARTTYTQIGATGWLDRLEKWGQGSHTDLSGIELRDQLNATARQASQLDGVQGG